MAGTGALAGAARAHAGGGDVGSGMWRGAIGGLAGGAVGRAWGGQRAGLIGAGVGGFVPKAKQAGLLEQVRAEAQSVQEQRAAKGMMSPLRRGGRGALLGGFAGGTISLMPSALGGVRPSPGMFAAATGGGALLGGVTEALRAARLRKAIEAKGGLDALQAKQAGLVEGVLTSVKNAAVRDAIKNTWQTVKRNVNEAIANPKQTIQASMGAHKMKAPSGGEQTYTPLFGSSSVLPMGRLTPGLNVNVLPMYRVSPNVGVGDGGFQLGITEKNRPSAVPKDSIVGKGLEAQGQRGGGVDVEVTPNHAKLRSMSKNQDWLMGHEKLNPNFEQAPDGKKKKAGLVMGALKTGAALRGASEVS